jgi:hypothetical protein
MTATTPKFGIHYPVDADPVYMLPRVLKTMATDVDTAMGALTYNGADPNSVLSRVAALEGKVVALQNSVPSVSSYLRAPSFAVPTGGAYVPSFAADIVGSGVSYNGTEWTFSDNCVVTASLAASKSRVSTWAADQRQWVEFRAFFGGVENGLARSQFNNEDNLGSAYAGRFAAGDKLRVFAYHSYSGGQPFGPFRLVLSVQRLL